MESQILLIILLNNDGPISKKARTCEHFQVEFMFYDLFHSTVSEISLSHVCATQVSVSKQKI